MEPIRESWVNANLSADAGNKVNQWESLPKEIILEIFSSLDFEPLSQAVFVCKRWKVTIFAQFFSKTSSLKKFFPYLQVIDEEAWKAHVDAKIYKLEFKRLVPTFRTFVRINKMIRQIVIEETEKGFTFLTIPKGLSIIKLKDIAERFKKQDGIIPFKYVMGGDAYDFSLRLYSLSENLCRREIEKTEFIMLPNSLLKGSRSLSAEVKSEMAHNVCCQVPKLIQVIALNVMDYIINYQKIRPFLFYLSTITNPEGIKRRLNVRTLTEDKIPFGYDELTKCLCCSPSDVIDNETIGLCPVKVIEGLP